MLFFLVKAMASYGRRAARRGGGGFSEDKSALTFVRGVDIGRSKLVPAIWWSEGWPTAVCRLDADSLLCGAQRLFWVKAIYTVHNKCTHLPVLWFVWLRWRDMAPAGRRFYLVFFRRRNEYRGIAF